MLTRHKSPGISRLVIIAALACLPCAVNAYNVTTEPIGAFDMAVKGNSDTRVSLPLHRPAEYEAKVMSVSGNVITVANPATFTGNQFVYSAGNQTNTYFVKFTTGTREGMFYTIVANDAVTLTVDPAGDTIAGSGNVVAGDAFQIIPYWTLNTTFPDGKGTYPTASFGAVGRQSAILLPNTTTPGENLASSLIYYYYNGTDGGGAGWRKSGEPGTIVNDLVLYPDNAMIVRFNVAGDKTVRVAGTVPVTAYATPLSTLAANMSQDIDVAVSVPTAVTLSESQLVESGAFVPSSGFGALVRNDMILVFDNAATGQNKAAFEFYYYYNGTANNGPGWRKSGDITTLQNNAQVFQPGNGYVIRKKATPTPTTTIWRFVPFYLSQ